MVGDIALNAMKLGTCPNCNEGVLLPDESAELGYYMGISDITHHSCDSAVQLIPYIDYDYEQYPFDY